MEHEMKPFDEDSHKYILKLILRAAGILWRSLNMDLVPLLRGQHPIRLAAALGVRKRGAI